MVFAASGFGLLNGSVYAILHIPNRASADPGRHVFDVWSVWPGHGRDRVEQGTGLTTGVHFVSLKRGDRWSLPKKSPFRASFDDTESVHANVAEKPRSVVAIIVDEGPPRKGSLRASNADAKPVDAAVVGNASSLGAKIAAYDGNLLRQSQSSSLAGAAMMPPGIKVGPGFLLSLPDPVMSSAPGMYLREANSSLQSTARSLVLVSVPETEDCVESSGVEGPDYCSDIQDDILACIFQFLSTGDWKQCSRLCRRWLLLEGQSRHRLSLKEQSKCVYLEILHVERTPEYTNLGLERWGRWYGCGNRTMAVF